MWQQDTVEPRTRQGEHPLRSGVPGKPEARSQAETGVLVRESGLDKQYIYLVESKSSVGSCHCSELLSCRPHDEAVRVNK